MKKIKYILVSGLLLLSNASCSDWLEVVPENSQVSDDYWKTEQDVENVLYGGYYNLRSMVETNLIPYGELRAGLIYSTGSYSVLQKYQITATSSVCNWATFYKIINIANTVLSRASEAYKEDVTYTESELNSHYTEAYFLRALTYFYLVRNWKEVPLITNAYEDDSETLNVSKNTEEEIIAQIKKDITTALATGAAKESFSTTWETKGRATKWALYALMADVCLWSEDYETAITYCDYLLKANSAKAPSFLSTASRSSWFSMFNPGNSNESIFELQWNYEEDQTNNLPIFFDDQNASGMYQYSEAITKEIVTEYINVMGDAEDESGASSAKESARTYHAGFYPGGISGMNFGLTTGYCWKYLGSATEDQKRTTNYYDPNFIIYRVAEVILMKAEALLLVDGDEPTASHKVEAVQLINKIRTRAGLENEIEADEDEVEMYSQEELLEKVLYEYKIEFLGEGKIWYDFLRFGRRNNNKYKTTFLINNVVDYDSQASESWIKSVLSSDNALFLPIYNNEIESNPNLIQNPYYN